MRYVNLGTRGPMVSRICLGMMSYGDTSRRPWHLDEEAARPIVRTAVEGGVTMFDTADVYDNGASEIITGKLLRSLFTSREDYVLATKVYYPMYPAPQDEGLSRKHIMTAIDASLRRLGTEYVDLYQIHRWDAVTPIEETMETLHDLVRAGKIRWAGASSMYAWQLAKAQSAALASGWEGFVSMQNHYNLVYREEEREMLPLCEDEGIGILPYSPLARGLLAAGRTRKGARTTARSQADPLADEMYNEADFEVIDEVRNLAAERGVRPAQVALSWLLGNTQVVSPIVGATKLAHLEDALTSIDIHLTPEECARVEAPYQPHRILGHD